MRVCILTSVHGPFDDRIFHKEAMSLVRAGYEVILIAPHKYDEKSAGIQVIAVSKNRTRLGRMLLTPIKIFLSGLHTEAAVYHFHDPELIPVGLLLRMLGKKVMYDIHEYNADVVLTKQWLPSAVRPTVSRAVMWLDRYAVKKMSGVVVVNEDMARLFRIGLPSLHPIVAVHNYPEVADTEYAYDGTASEPVGIYVGWLSKDRGLEILLQAGERLKRAYPGAKLQLLGPLDLAGVRSEYARIDQWGSVGVEYLGVVAHHEVPGRLRRARVGLVPLLPTLNHGKSMPVKLFEYMLAGLPVVASDFGVIRQIVQETQCGLLVPPGDSDALSEAVESLLAEPDKAADMGRKGRRAVIERYNWGPEEKKLLTLYGDILGHA